MLFRNPIGGGDKILFNFLDILTFFLNVEQSTNVCFYDIELEFCEFLSHKNKIDIWYAHQVHKMFKNPVFFLGKKFVPPPLLIFSIGIFLSFQQSRIFTLTPNNWFLISVSYLHTLGTLCGSLNSAEIFEKTNFLAYMILDIP